MADLDRSEYRNNYGRAAWWPKDGAWHIAIPSSSKDGLFWHEWSFASREDAIASLNDFEALGIKNA